MNMKNKGFEEEIAAYMKILGAPFRIKILYAIGKGEACVCHLETVLKKRQAYISQHLMVMKDAGLLEARREGKYIFYRVSDQAVFDLIQQAAGLLNLHQGDTLEISEPSVFSQCLCPNCDAETKADPVVLISS